METCPSCNALVNSGSKFCTECGVKFNDYTGEVNSQNIPKKSYKLRSPILESDILTDDTKDNKYGLLNFTAYCFWAFALVYFIYGAKTIYDSYTVNLFKGVLDSSLLFGLSALSFMVPDILKLFINIEDHLLHLAKDSKKDKNDQLF